MSTNANRSLPEELAKLTSYVRENFMSMKHMTFGCKPADVGGANRGRFWIFVQNRAEPKRFLEFDGKQDPISSEKLLMWVDGVMMGFQMSKAILEGEREATQEYAHLAHVAIGEVDK